MNDLLTKALSDLCDAYQYLARSELETRSNRSPEMECVAYVAARDLLSRMPPVPRPVIWAPEAEFRD